MSPIDRRRFLQGAAAVAATAAAPLSASPLPASAGTTAAGKRVVVLGGGLAGLSSAYNLMKAGYHVSVLEAQNRPGGRVHTVRDGFRNGGHAELGAIRIFETHEFTNRYVQQFGLELVPYDTGQTAFFLDGKRFVPPPAGQPWPLAGLTPAEQLDPTALIRPYLLAGFTNLGDVHAANWPGGFPSTQQLDGETITQYLLGQGASREWVNWFLARQGHLGGLNALSAFAEESVALGKTVSSIKGGNDLLPKAFAKLLGSRIKYLSQVVRIAPVDKGVRVNYRDRTGLHELAADHVVCALPMPPLRRVSLGGGFSLVKLAVIRELEYVPAAQSYFQTRSRFWTKDPLGPLGGLDLVQTDQPIGRIWNTSSQQDDPTLGMIQSYMLDADATDFASHGPAARLERLRGRFERVLPGFRGQELAAISKVWQDDPWAGGLSGLVPPGDMHWMFPAMRRAESRVHFAGEHTSLWWGWMNGALESAERVVGEILSADHS